MFLLVHSDQLSLQQNKQKKFLETDNLQLGHVALGDLQDSGVVGLPLCIRAVFGDAVSHRTQIRFREESVTTATWFSPPSSVTAR